MLEDKYRKFRLRLGSILKVEIEKDRNGTVQMQIYPKYNELTTGTLKYTQYMNLVGDNMNTYSFIGVSEDTAIVSGFMHDGSNRDNGGYGSRAFEITMQNGSHKVLVGPWSSRPSVHMMNGAPKYLEALVVYGENNHYHQGFSKEFLEAVIDEFKVNVKLERTERRNSFDNSIEVNYEVVTNTIID